MAKPDDDTLPTDPVKAALFKALGHMVQAPAPATTQPTEPAAATPPADPVFPAPEETPDEAPFLKRKAPSTEELQGGGNGESLRDQLRYMRRTAKEADAPAKTTADTPAAETTPAAGATTTPTEQKVEVRRPKIEAPPVAVPTEPAETPAPAAVEGLPDDLSEDELEEIELARFAEATEPGKYAGYTKKVTDFIKKHRDFMVKQQETDPSVEFDRDNEQYQNFLKAHKATLSTGDRKKLARAKLIDEAKREAKKEWEAETRELRAKQREIEIRPQIKATVTKVREEALKLIDNEAAKAIVEKGKDAEADYALEAGIINEFVSLAENAANEFLYLAQGLAKPDAKNQTHVWLFNFINEQSELFEKHGGDARVRDGKKFVSRVKYAQMKPEERANSFTLSDSDVLQLITLSAKYGAEQQLASKQKELEKAGYVKKTAAPAKSTTAAAETAPPRARSTPAPGNAESPTPKRDPFLSAILGR